MRSDLIEWVLSRGASSRIQHGKDTGSWVALLKNKSILLGDAVADGPMGLAFFCAVFNECNIIISTILRLCAVFGLDVYPIGEKDQKKDGKLRQISH